MEPISVATLVAKPAAKQILSFLSRKMNENDEQLRREREEAALDWAAELKRAVPQAVAYLDARIDDLDNRLAKVFEDPQFGRIFTNFTYEAAREAIDERRRMLALASIGIAEPDTSVERKARVERTLRGLDPIDVLTLYGASLIPGGLDALVPMSKFLQATPSGDILAACGCVRMEPDGGGAGAGVWSRATITQVGSDVLMALRLYTKSRPLPFVVPGREIGPGDRTEQEAREILDAVPGLSELTAWTVRKSSAVDRIYARKRPGRSSALLTFYFHGTGGWKDRLPSLQDACANSLLSLELGTQPYHSSTKGQYELLRAELSGPHDVLRYLADDCEAFWETGPDAKSA